MTFSAFELVMLVMVAVLFGGLVGEFIGSHHKDYMNMKRAMILNFKGWGSGVEKSGNAYIPYVDADINRTEIRILFKPNDIRNFDMQNEEFVATYACEFTKRMMQQGVRTKF